MHDALSRGLEWRECETLSQGLERTAACFLPEPVGAAWGGSDSPDGQRRFETQWRMEAYAMTTSSSIPHRIHIP